MDPADRDAPQRAGTRGEPRRRDERCLVRIGNVLRRYWDLRQRECRSSPVFEVYSNGSWADMAAPSVGDFGSYSAVTCPTVGTCYPIGDTAAAPFKQEPTVATYSDGTWSAQALQLPNDVNSEYPDSALDSISCISATSCVAVGGY
jgi:(2Fe-2S) ferredoxin